MEAKKEPVRRFRVGSVTAAVWKNDNNGTPSFSVTLQKSYKGTDEKTGGEVWKDTHTLFHGDVVCALKALERAEAFIAQ